MPSLMQKLAQRIDTARAGVLRGEDQAEALHRLRVAVRRLRSLLRHSTSSGAHHLRRELGQLVKVTNTARDWDTLLSRLRDSADTTESQPLHELLAARRSASYVPVQAVLQSAQWRDARHDLKAFIKHYGRTIALEAHAEVDLKWAQRRVYRAWRTAEAADDDRHWHKLRVAAKELRYCLETIPKGERDGATTEHLKRCKQLQRDLGDWHDCVVHAGMLRALADDSTIHDDLREVLRDWCLRIDSEGRNCLDAAVAVCQSVVK